MTVSLLPDCLASRLPATLAQVERAVDKVEGAGGSVAAAAARMHPVTEQVDHVQSAERRLRRWRRGLYAALVSLAGLMPCKLAGRAATLLGWRTALGADPVLVALRAEAAEHLAGLPPPLGFGPRPTMRKKPVSRLQQRAGPDPPPVGV